MTSNRAIKGGQIAPNGEFYKGGQFINTIEANPKKGGRSTKRTGKREIAPYVWEVQPTPESRSIYTKVAGIYGRVEDGVLVLNINPVTLEFYGDDESQIRELAARWNAGERWV